MYKKTLFFVFYLTFSGNLSHAQKIEVSGGVHQKKIINKSLIGDSKYSKSQFSPGNGFGLYVALDSLRYEFMVYRFTLGFEQYQVGFNNTFSELGDSYLENGDVVVSRLILGIYPGNFSIQKLDINLGVELGFLVGEKTTGTSASWTVDQPSWEIKDLEDIYGGSANLTAALKLRLAYDIYVAKNLAISPIFSTSYVFVDGFKEYSMRSFKMFVGVGVERTLSN